MSRVFHSFLRVLASLVAVLILALGVLIWRVASEPLTATNLTPYIEQAVASLFPQSSVQIGRTMLVWDNADHSLALRAETVRVLGPQGNTVLSFPSAKIRLSVLGLIQGRLVPSELAVDKPELRLVHKADGAWTFGGDDVEADKKDNQPVSFDKLHSLADEVTQDGLSHDLSMTDAIVSVHDEAEGKDWTIDVPEVALHHGWHSLSGIAKISLQAGDKNAIVQARYEYERQASRHRLALQFSEINPTFLAGQAARLAPLAVADFPLTGEVVLFAGKDFDLQGVRVRVLGGEGFLRDGDLWDAPRAVKGSFLNASFDKASNKIEVEGASIDFGGPKLSLKINGGPSMAPAPDGKAYDCDFEGEVKLTDLPMDSFASVWPKIFVPNARLWIADSMKKGGFKQGTVSLKGKFSWNDLGGLWLENASGKLSAHGGTVFYLDGMPPIEGVGAEASFDLDHMDVQITGGTLGALKLLPFTIKMTDFEKDVQNIEIPLKLTGPAKDVVKLLAYPRLDYAKEVGLTPADTDGKIEGVVTLKFPLLADVKMSDVALFAKAKLADFGSKNLVPGFPISKGALDLDLNKDGFDVKGDASLSSVPLHVVWHGNFGGVMPRYKGAVSGPVVASDWAALGLDMSKQVKGTTEASLNYIENRKGMAQISGEVQFKQATVDAKEVGWKKAEGVPASVVFSADLPDGRNVKIKNIEVKASGVKIKGTGVLDGKTSQLLELSFKPFVIGRDNASVLFRREPAAKGGAQSIVLEGESFDISGLSDDEDDKNEAKKTKEPKTPAEYKLKLNRLYTSEDGFLAQVQGRLKRDALGWSEIDLRALAQGTQPLDFKLGAVEGKNTLLFTSNNFGTALKGLGFTDTVEGGSLEIRGEGEKSDPRLIVGKIKIGSFSVRGLPALVRLLNAASPFGFADLISGEASFDRLIGHFKWRGDQVELSKVKATGSVFGINVDGHADLNSGEANLHGTLVPFSFVNSILGGIPLLGDMITGGEGQGVLAASYTVKGPFADPSISVNPVSLLTPGFLRNLFFSGEEGESLEPEKEMGKVAPKQEVAPSVSGKASVPSSNNLKTKAK